MGAQSSLNSIMSSVLGSAGAVLDIDKKMGMKARSTVKNKINAISENKKLTENRRVGGIK